MPYTCLFLKVCVVNFLKYLNRLIALNIVEVDFYISVCVTNLVYLFSGSESSSEDSDSDNRHKLSAAAVSSDWVLSGTAVKGWTSKQSKVETGIFSKALSKDWAKKKSSVYGSITNAPYDPVTAKDELSRGYESLSEISCTNNNSKEVQFSILRIPQTLLAASIFYVILIKEYISTIICDILKSFSFSHSL